jgi:hypothetical protein
MDAIELRRRGVELLSPVLVPYGFVYQAGEVDRGSGGLYTHGGFARANRSLEFSVRHALGEVRYRVDAATLLHEDFARAAVGRGQARYPGFSDDPLDGFRDLATDLVRFGSVFLAGTTAEFAALVTKAERTRPPRGLPRSPLAITLLGGPGRTLGRDRRGTLRRERGTRRSNVRDSAR